MLASDIIRVLKSLGLLVYADSADPRLIQEISNAGIVIYPADKYKGSVMGGLLKMMEYKICITRKSVNLIREFRNYIYEQNKDGKFINEPIDAYNHGIDASRYYVIGKLLGKILVSRSYSKGDLGMF